MLNRIEIARDVATGIGAVPFLWLLLRRPTFSVGAWFVACGFLAWFVACGFLASFVADVAVRWSPLTQWVVSPVYLITQTLLMCAAFRPPREAWRILFTLLWIAGGAIFVTGAERPDVLLHTVAFGLMVGVAQGPFRWALYVAFGAGLVAWWYYVASPGWPSWLSFQSCRLVGAGLFCVAARE